jgi:phage gpG-like protein
VAYKEGLEYRTVAEGHVFGGSIIISVEGDATLRAHIGHIRDRVDDLTPFWEEQTTRELFFRSERDIFQRRGYPETWPPLAASTLARKKGPGILRETDRMYRSVTSQTSDTIFEYSARNVSFGTRVEYAPYHMTGTRNMPPRPFMAMTPESFRAFRDLLGKWLMGDKAFG